MTKLRRVARHGFTLLESLIAFALLAMVLGISFAIAAQMITRQGKSTLDLEMSQLAMAVLKEYAVTWPQMPPNGQLGERFSWRVMETNLPSDGRVENDLNFRYVRLDVTIIDLSGTVPDLTRATAVLRRRTP